MSGFFGDSFDDAFVIFFLLGSNIVFRGGLASPGGIDPIGAKGGENTETGIIKNFLDGSDIGEALGENADVGSLLDRLDVI